MCDLSAKCTSTTSTNKFTDFPNRFLKIFTLFRTNATHIIRYSSSSLFSHWLTATGRTASASLIRKCNRWQRSEPLSNVVSLLLQVSNSISLHNLLLLNSLPVAEPLLSLQHPTYSSANTTDQGRRGWKRRVIRFRCKSNQTGSPNHFDEEQNNRTQNNAQNHQHC